MCAVRTGAGFVLAQHDLRDPGVRPHRSTAAAAGTPLRLNIENCAYTGAASAAAAQLRC